MWEVRRTDTDEVISVEHDVNEAYQVLSCMQADGIHGYVIWVDDPAPAKYPDTTLAERMDDFQWYVVKVDGDGDK